MFAIVGGVVIRSILDGLVAVGSGAPFDPFCSGILVAPDTVVTAAHCVTGGPLAVATGVDVARAPADVVEVIGHVTHPDAAEGDRATDLAVLFLASDLGGRTLPLSDTPPEVEDRVSVAGFGATADGAGDAGVKRGVSLSVVSVDGPVALSFSPEGNTCSGDSGGPLLLARGEEVSVIGVNTWVDPSCVGGRTGSTLFSGSWAFLLAETDAALGPLPPPPADPPEARGCDASGGRAGVGSLWVIGAVVLRQNRRIRHPRSAESGGSGGAAWSAQGGTVRAFLRSGSGNGGSA